MDSYTRHTEKGGRGWGRIDNPGCKTASLTLVAKELDNSTNECTKEDTGCRIGNPFHMERPDQTDETDGMTHPERQGPVTSEQGTRNAHSECELHSCFVMGESQPTFVAIG